MQVHAAELSNMSIFTPGRKRYTLGGSWLGKSPTDLSFLLSDVPVDYIMAGKVDRQCPVTLE